MILSIAVAAFLWCLILSIVVSVQAETINTLMRRSLWFEDLWEKQNRMNEYLEKDLSRVEDKLGI